jgi:sortase A
MGIDETTPSANRGSLVQVDAHRANVAFARPVRVPDVRAAASGVLGRPASTPGGHKLSHAHELCSSTQTPVGRSGWRAEPEAGPMRLRSIIPATAHRTVVRYFFLVLAIACLGLYSYAYLERVLYQTYESREFDRTPDRSAAAVAASNDQITPIGRVVRASRKSVSSSRLPSPTALIGRLSVPRLHLSAMVREGIDRNTLQLAVGHIPATALPGQAGNVGVAGHRDTFFRGLKDLRTKDEIQFSTLSGDFKYVVESLIIVEPDDVGVLAPSHENVLTLVTCYPFSYIGTAPRRFVVRARQVSPQTPARLTVE